ncbi:MAG: hypothetical protein IT306_17765 [Chloroflexi bacterium]|nr:hypothetical protein [Chloroflexota bacterium]
MDPVDEPLKTTVQDDRRENELRELFNLERIPSEGRAGIDAHLTVDGVTVPFELKSSTGKGVTTVRDFGPDHVQKWRIKHWLIGFYDRSGRSLQFCLYGSPSDMAPWIDEKLAYTKSDRDLADILPGELEEHHLWSICGRKQEYAIADAKLIYKNQWKSRQYEQYCDRFKVIEGLQIPSGYSPERMLEILRMRARYVILRGSTLNNPHIPLSYFAGWPRITANHSEELRRCVRAWLAQSQ